MSKQKAADGQDLITSWTLPYAATLGSSVRRQGIFLEARARLSSAARRALTISQGRLRLQMPADAASEFESASSVVSEVVLGIEGLPVIPREVEDILSISTSERHRWLKDGRLPSAGVRTVKLRGRAKSVTFHVFDPHIVEEILDRDLVAGWREDDTEKAAENRRRAQWKARLTRKREDGGETTIAENEAPGLHGWEEFAREGLLR